MHKNKGHFPPLQQECGGLTFTAIVMSGSRKIRGVAAERKLLTSNSGRELTGFYCNACGWTMPFPRFMTLDDLKAAANNPFESHDCAKFPKKKGIGA